MASYLVTENGKVTTYNDESIKSIKGAVKAHMGDRTHANTVLTVYRIAWPPTTVKVGTKTTMDIQTIKTATVEDPG